MKNVSLAARRLACPRASLNILICDKASEALIKRALILAGITIAMCATPARAWDDQGHMMVAAVAWEKLNPAVKKRAIELLKLNPDYETFIARVPSELQDQVAFVRAATWPDMIKKDPRYTNDGDDNSVPNSSLNIGYRDNLQHRYGRPGRCHLCVARRNQRIHRASMLRH